MPFMPKDEPHLEQLLRMLPEDLAGTITVSRLIWYLRTLPQDSPIGTSITQSGQKWYLSLSLSDLSPEQSGTERTKTRPTSKCEESQKVQTTKLEAFSYK